MKKGLAVLGTTIVGGLAAGVLSGMVVNEALKYDPEDLKRDLAKRDEESIKKHMSKKDRVAVIGSVGLALGMMALGGTLTASAVSESKRGKDDKYRNDDCDKVESEPKAVYYYDCTGLTVDEVAEVVGGITGDELKEILEEDYSQIIDTEIETETETKIDDNEEYREDEY